MNILQKLCNKKTKLCIGLMSGTSMDGVDAALVRITGSGVSSRIELIDWHTYPYPRGLKERLIDYINRDSIELSSFSQLNFMIGGLFADAVEQLLTKNNVAKKDVDLIGSHGQTLWHNPKAKQLFKKRIHSTLQIGEPSVIQARTGIVTVADFRVKDVAHGGAGAPLMPYFDYVIFRSKSENRGLLNIGGIANITVLSKNAPLDEVYAFDTGPGNMLIDQLMKTIYNKHFDADGAAAGKANFNRRLLSKMMRYPFITRTPPKSTGREDFGAEFVVKIRDWAGKLKINTEEMLSTATEFTVRSIAKNYELFIEPRCRLSRIIVSGGGAQNSEIMKRLRGCLPDIIFETTGKYGVPPDCKEAVAFALFANEAIACNAVNISGVTGAKTPAVLGKIIY